MIPRALFAFAAPGALALALCLPAAAEAQTRGAAGARPPAAAVPASQRALSFVAEAPAAGGVLVLPLSAEGDLAGRATSLSEAERGAVGRALTSSTFSY